MSERINTPFTNEHFVAFCQSMLGQPYWYGTVVYKCTESLRARKAKQYPSHYVSSRTNRYRDDIAKKKVCADCVGLIKGYCWTDGGQGVMESIGTDREFSGMFTYAKSKGCAWGTMDSLPELPGVALRSDGHVGVYIGGGYAVEERGFNYGCVKTRVSSRNWTHWYKLPFIDYGEGAEHVPATEYTLGSRLLKKGMEGSDVKTLQELLLQLGYALSRYGADGEFGAETETAVKAFQTAEGLEVDGKYGEKSHAALMDAVADDDEDGSEQEGGDVGAPVEPEEPDAPDEPESPKPLGETVVIVSNGGKVNIRYGNGTNYARITSVQPGSTYAYVATAANGWNAVAVNGKVGWVSGEYSKRI